VTRIKAEEYRRLAQECLAMARTVSTEEARDSLRAMTQVWHRLADEQNQGAELAEMPTPPPATEQTQPVQQQQQIQSKDDDQKENNHDYELRAPGSIVTAPKFCATRLNDVECHFRE
jgi:hypothetical protein